MDIFDSADCVYGVHPVMNAVHSKRAKRVILSQSGPHESRLRDEKVELLVLAKNEFNEKFGGLPHQGMVAECAPLRMEGQAALQQETQITQAPPASADKTTDYPLYLMLDSITDPQNFGACLRCAVAFGSRGVIFARDNSAAINALCCKASAGMIEWVRLIRIPNLARALIQLKEAGFWVMAADSAEGETPENLDLVRPLILLVGAEDKGIRHGLQAKADLHCRIPLNSPAESLNVATATAVCMSSIRSQQRGKQLSAAKLPSSG